MAKSIQATTLLLIAVILATVSAPTRTAFADAAGDRAVLVALYNAGGGDNWTNRSNWLSDEPINDWYGITTDANGRVTRLYLSDNNLAGDLPAELGDLANLKELYLGGRYMCIDNVCQPVSPSANQLTGEIPPELGNLSNLEWLHIGTNQLTGEIPTELGNLSNLEWLDLGVNQLTGEIPTELGNLSKLEHLGLLHNQLTGEIPSELGDLSNLEWLHLGANQLTGEIPSELGDLSNLEWLHLGANQLTGEIPPELGNLSNLENLWLSANQLTGRIPPELSNLSNLKVLFLSENQLTGCVPAALRNVPIHDLAELGLDFCTADVPGAPMGLTAQVTQDEARVALSWTAPPSTGGAPITGYLIESSMDGHDPWTEVFTTTGDATSYTDVGTDANGPTFGVETMRHYRVSAINSVGTGPPSNAAIATPDACRDPLGALTAPVTRLGAWARDCPSTARSGSYARYYSFSLSEAKQVEINLTSAADPYLALRRGEGSAGEIVASNDNVGSRNFNSSINRVLEAGDYTVEATTYFAGQSGNFTLSVRPLLETEDLGPLTRSVDRSNSRWTSDYLSTQRMMDSYARSYTFTLYAATHMVINLTSPEDPYLFLLDSRGAVVHENDNVTTRNLNSRIDETLPAGTYTIEATTYFPARAGTFHLSIGYFGVSQ